MIRVALRGLVARPAAHGLTTMAIVLGVAMVSGAFTLTDTMRAAPTDSLSAPPTTAPTPSSPPRPPSRSTDGLDGAAARRSPRNAARARPRRCRRSAVAVGDVTDEAKIIGPRRQARRRGPVLRRRLRRLAPGAEQPHARSASTRPLGHRPGRGRASTRRPPSKQHYAVGDKVTITTPARRATFASSASRRSATSSRSAPRPPPCSTCAPRRTLFDKQRPLRRILVGGSDGRRAADVRAAIAARLGPAARSRPRARRTASRSTA